MNYFSKVGAIVRKDLTAELRSRDTLVAMLVFAFLVIVVFAFAFTPTREILRAVFPGMIWVTITFAGILGLNRSFTSERLNDTMLGLLMAPVDRTAILLGKVLANLIFVGLVELVTVPLFFIFFDYRAENLAWLPLVLLVGTVGFITVGTFLAALAANTKTSEILLPVILFPLLIPVLIGAVAATSLSLNGEIGTVFYSWLKLLLVYDVVFTVIPLVLFEYVVEV